MLCLHILKGAPMDIQPGSQVKFILACMRYRGVYLGDDEQGQARVQTNKHGVMCVDKALLRPTSKPTSPN